ncbi:hypothetical protein SDC9_84620 [bioreactor metagenome]|uniref:Uncharacterized protein n=1 Tax=bioreactor metagenome TaxID=1076179 RepID=A0A644ZBD2_9ZZZZ
MVGSGPAVEPPPDPPGPFDDGWARGPDRVDESQIGPIVGPRFLRVPATDHHRGGTGRQGGPADLDKAGGDGTAPGRGERLPAVVQEDHRR